MKVNFQNAIKAYKKHEQNFELFRAFNKQNEQELFGLMTSLKERKKMITHKFLPKTQEEAREYMQERCKMLERDKEDDDGFWTYGPGIDEKGQLGVFEYHWGQSFNKDYIVTTLGCSTWEGVKNGMPVFKKIPMTPEEEKEYERICAHNDALEKDVAWSGPYKYFFKENVDMLFNTLLFTTDEVSFKEKKEALERFYNIRFRLFNWEDGWIGEIVCKVFYFWLRVKRFFRNFNPFKEKDNG